MDSVSEMRGNCWANMLLRVSHSVEISSGEISGKFSAVSLAISGVSISVGEVFAISPVRMSVDSAGIAAISGLSGWIKTSFSILSPVISSIELTTVMAG
ncbi:MAG: hypothetical protein U7126_05790 [Microcoleus sp.]